MTDDCVWSCRDDLLAGGYCDGRGRKGVFLEDQEDDKKANHHENVPRNDNKNWDVRPGKAMVEGRNNHFAKECKGCERLYQLLAFFLLRYGPRVHAPFKKLRIFAP